ncbi:hypothetical protein ACAW75_04540 [Fibrella sp. Tmos10]
MAIRSGKIDLVAFPEMKPDRDESIEIHIDESSFTQDEIEYFLNLCVKMKSFPQTATVLPTRETKIALLKACSAGVLNLASVPQLNEAYQNSAADISALSEEDCNLLVRVARAQRS